MAEDYETLALEAYLSEVDRLDEARSKKKKRLGVAAAGTLFPVWLVVDAVVSWPGAWPPAFFIVLAFLGVVAGLSWLAWYGSHREVERFQRHVERMAPSRAWPALEDPDG